MHNLIQKWAIRLMVLGLVVMGTALLASAPQPTYAQGSLSPGDIAFVGYNADANDDFAIVALTDLDGSGTPIDIIFSDNEWDGSSFNTGEGTLTWTIDSLIAAGTVISFNNISSSGTATVSVGSLSGSMALGASDEAIFAITGSTASPTAFLAAITNDDFAAAGASLTNTGLTVGTTAIELDGVDADADIAIYNGLRSGEASFAAYLVLINNPTNWLTQDGSGDQSNDSTVPDLPFDTTAFTIAASYDLQITEIWPGQAGTDLTDDWFEIYNAGGAAWVAGSDPDLYYDDDSADPAVADMISGITDIQPGESVIVMVDSTDTATFSTVWSPAYDLTGIEIGYTGAAAGLGGSSDAVTLWVDVPSVSNTPVDTEAYSNADSNDAQSYDVVNAAYSTDGGGAAAPGTNVAAATIVLGGSNSDVPAVGSPGNQGPVVSNPNATTVQVDTANLTPFLSLPANDTGSASGTISDPTDPASIIGIPFDFADPDTDLGDLTVTVTSDNQSVVPDINLIMLGTGADRVLTITPVGVGLANITVTVEDLDTNTDTYVIQYAASTAAVTPSTSRFHTGASDGSTAIPVDADYAWVGDDEDQVLRLYDRDDSGLPLTEIDFNSALGVTQEVDIEGSFVLNNTIYWIGSHASADRSILFTTTMSGAGASATVTYGDKYTSLRDDLIAWDSNDDHGLGANFFGLSTSFEIEGLALAPGSTTTAYLGFRGPLSGNNALIVPVTNFTALPGSGGPATFGAPILLDMDGRSVRSIECNANGCVIIGGPVGTVNDFKLFTWSGNSADAPQLREADLTALNTDGSFEGIVELPNSTFLGSDGDTDSIALLVDNGTTDFYNTTQEAKDLRDEWKKFRTEVVTLGPVVVPMTAAPVINEFVADHDGTDNYEYIEIYGDPNTDYSNYTIVEIEGDGSSAGLIDDAVATVGTTDANGFWLASFSNVIENGNITLLLVEGYSGSVGNDIDTDNDGVIDTTYWTSIVDSVGSDDGGTIYSPASLTASFDGGSFQVGGASRIPDGTDTDTTADWVRNDYDGAGIPALDPGTPEEGEAFNTPGATNQIVTPPAPELQITEIWPGNANGTNLTQDWFEIVNTGTVTWTPALGDLYFDDDSQAPADADPISGIAAIAPGEAVIAIDDTDTAEFISVWGPVYDLTGIQIGTYAGAGLGQGGDGVTLWIGDPVAGGTLADFEAYPASSAGASFDVEKQAFSQVGEQPYEPVETAVNDQNEPAVGSPGNQGPVLPAALVITEIMYNPASTEDDWEWVEVYNAGDSTVDLSGYVIDDNNSVAHSSASIASGSLPAGQSAVLYNADDVSEADFLAAWGNVNLIAVTDWNAMGLGNGGDTIGIWDSFANYDGDNATQANVIEQVTYDDSSPWPVDDGAGSIYLTDLAADNSDGSNWALSTDGATTPLFDAYTALAAGGNSGSDIGSPGTPAATGHELPLTEVFDDCTLAGWQIISVDADTAHTWSCSESFSNVDVNGFGDSAPADEWLITPPLNMDAQEYDRLTFRNYTNFTDANYPQLEVLYSTDFSGDPTTATWMALSGINFSPEGSGQFVDSGEVDLSGISGTNVYFAFHYTSSGTGSGTAANWRIDEVNFFEGTPQGQPLPLTEVFDDCTLASWQIISVDSDTAHTWSCSESFSN
ncbi:MAG: lamin tail domain-containing protein, partial [Anaerolineae bacterium]|nr:lamin tail domain-containing protein [Anaerolineae bacterium]